MTGNTDRFIRVLAPLGRDAELLTRALRARGHTVDACKDIDSLCKVLEDGAGAVVLTQEALALPGFARLVGMLREQPPWSDLPFVVLVSGGKTLNPGLTEVLTALDDSTNSSVLERPVRMETIVHAVESALRVRGRQYELREHLEARTQAEEAERRARAEAEDALRARDEFLSIASHELRNPVAVISGTSQLLRRAHESGRLTDSRLLTYIESLETGGRRLATLTADLLDVSRVQRGELPLRPQETDMVGMVRDLVRRGEWTDHHVALEIDEQSLPAMVDPDRISQVVWNLLDNATKYSPDGGEVRVHLRRDGEGVLLEVHDQGIGLEEGAQESIFTPFNRAPNATEANIPGLGLRLYLSRRIAEQHHGRLWARSDGEGMGTVMSLWVPLARLPAE